MSEVWFEGKRFGRRVTFRFGDCNANKRASLYTLLKIFSEMAGEDYEHREMGYELLQEKGQAFVVSRQSIAIKKLPVHTQTVHCTTWERCTKGPFFYREYEIHTPEGELLASSESMWLLVEPATREILRPAQLFGGLPEMDPGKSDCPDCKKLKRMDTSEALGERTIRYSDLDANGHVNNAVYTRIAADYLPQEYRERELSGFQINFCMETRLGETLEICGAPTDAGYFIQGVTGDTLHFACEYSY